jgi:hypothetical protein
MSRIVSPVLVGHGREHRGGGAHASDHHAQPTDEAERVPGEGERAEQREHGSGKSSEHGSAARGSCRSEAICDFGPVDIPQLLEGACDALLTAGQQGHQSARRKVADSVAQSFELRDEGLVAAFRAAHEVPLSRIVGHDSPQTGAELDRLLVELTEDIRVANKEELVHGLALAPERDLRAQGLATLVTGVERLVFRADRTLEGPGGDRRGRPQQRDDDRGREQDAPRGPGRRESPPARAVAR